MSLSATLIQPNPTGYTRKTSSDEAGTAASGYSWWSWRRVAADEKPKEIMNNKVMDYSSRDVGQQPDAEDSPQKYSPNTTLSSQKSTDETSEKLKKTLRLTSQQIVSYFYNKISDLF